MSMQKRILPPCQMDEMDILLQLNQVDEGGLVILNEDELAKTLQKEHNKQNQDQLQESNSHKP